MIITIGMCIPVIGVFAFMVLRQYLIQRKLVKMGVHRSIVAAEQLKQNKKQRIHNRNIAKNGPSILPHIPNRIEMLAGLGD